MNVEVDFYCFISIIGCLMLIISMPYFEYKAIKRTHI